MAKINLLPWREEQRKQLTSQFVSRLVLCALLTGAVVFYGYYHIGTLVDYQNKRNRYLQSEIQTLNARAFLSLYSIHLNDYRTGCKTTVV